MAYSQSSLDAELKSRYDAILSAYYATAIFPRAGTSTGVSMGKSVDVLAVPDRITAVTAWRAWAMSPTGHLWSLNYPVVWSPDKMFTARCDTHDHAPSAGHTCGVYALKDPDDAYRYRPQDSTGRLAVFGEVLLWGTVIEHQAGYRAQFAYPQSFYVADDRLDTSVWKGALATWQ